MTETSTVGFEQLNSMVPGRCHFGCCGGAWSAEQICTKGMKSIYGTRCIDSLHLVGACCCRFKRITCSVELAAGFVTVNIPQLALHLCQEGFRDCSAFSGTCHSEELLPHSADCEREGSSKQATHLIVSICPKLELT